MCTLQRQNISLHRASISTLLYAFSEKKQCFSHEHAHIFPYSFLMEYVKVPGQLRSLSSDTHH